MSSSRKRFALSRRHFLGTTAGFAAAGAAGASAVRAQTAPNLAIAPVIDLSVGVLPYTAWSAFFIAQDRGYFRDAGLNVRFVNAWTVTEQMPMHLEGHLPVVGGVGFANYEALAQRRPLRIVADLQSGGRTPRSTGNNALVVRKDLFEAGTIRKPEDVKGRTIATQSGEGGILHIMGANWLSRAGVDPKSVKWPHVPFRDVVQGMAEKKVELGFMGEPELSAGLAREVYSILATQEDMYPDIQVCWLQYWPGIEWIGPQVGERFMIGFLRGARDYVDAFEHGVRQDEAIATLTKFTTMKDPADWRRSKYAYVDPDGAVQKRSMERDARFLHGMGRVRDPVDLSLAQMFDDSYREFALRRLGPYKKPG